MQESDRSSESQHPRAHRRRGQVLARLLSGRMAVLGAVVAVVAVLLAVALVRLTGLGSPAAGEPTTPDPTASAATSPPSTPDGGSRDMKPGADPADKSLAGPGVCPAFPEFPDESCTGYRHTGVELRDCPNVIEQDGLTLDSCRFSQDLVIQAKDVTITRSFVDGTVYATYLTDWSLGDLTLIDVEIDGGGRVVDGRTAAIGDDDYTCIRCDMHGSERGANMGSNVHIEDSYMHGFLHVPGSHQSAIGTNGGNNLTLIHNNLDCESAGDACSAALALYPDFEPVDNVLVQNNLLNTNGGYCTYGGFDEGTNIRYIDNIFGNKYHPECGIWGPVAAFVASAEGNEWRGNVYPDGSEVVPKSDV
jgi:hypothetical protein